MDEAVVHWRLHLELLRRVKVRLRMLVERGVPHDGLLLLWSLRSEMGD